MSRDRQPLNEWLRQIAEENAQQRSHNRMLAEQSGDPLIAEAWKKYDRQRAVSQSQSKAAKKPDIELEAAAISRYYDAKEGHVSFGDNGKYARRLDMLPPNDVERLKLLHQLRVLGDIDEGMYDTVVHLICDGEGKADDYVKLHFESVLSRGSALGKKLVRRAVMGGNSWLTTDDIPGSIYDEANDSALVIGPLPDKAGMLQYSGEGSLCTIAPPGAGKTQCHLMSNLLRYKGPALVLDIKGDAWRKTSRWRANNVGPVWRFDPLDSACSAHYNPLSFVGHKRTWMHARQLASQLTMPGNMGSGDSYWQNRAQDFLTALIYVVAKHGTKQNRNMAKVCELASSNLGPLFDKMKKMDSDEARNTAGALSDLMHSSEKQWMGVIDSARAALGIWADEEVREITRDTSAKWHPQRLRQKPYPTIYLCVSPRDVELYAPVLRVIILQHVMALSAALPERGTMPVQFFLDELPRLGGNMQAIPTAIELGREYGIRLWIFAQTLAQLKDAYPTADGMVASCAVRAFMNPRMEDRTAQKVSEMLGFKESIVESGKTRLAEPTDLTGPDFKDVQIVFGSGTRPAKLAKLFAWQDTSIADRWGEVEP